MLLFWSPPIAASAGEPVEYFVSMYGSDAADGRTESTAFATVQKGLDVLAAGDTLTILPGQYAEAAQREDLGGDAQTLIRAKFAGTVLLRGDVPLPQFEKLDGYRFVYFTPWEQRPTGVFEIDTLQILKEQVETAAVEFVPGSYFYDEEAGALFVSSSDLQPPALHVYTAGRINRSGLLLTRPRNVVVQGIAATGFLPAENKTHDFAAHVSGIMMVEPVDCAIRDCTAYLNGNGICMVGGAGNAIERCTAYGNFTPFHAPAGNIVRFNSDREIIRDCLAYGSPGVGIKFYAAIDGPVTLEGNTSWGHGSDDFWIKGGGPGIASSIARRNIGTGLWHVGNVEHNLVGLRNTYRPEMSADNVVLAGLNLEREFADPENFDFRLQSKSTLRGTAPEGADRGPHPFAGDVFFVKPGGDDSADGMSVAGAWKTLERGLAGVGGGGTLYLLAGEYTAPAQVVGLAGREGRSVRIRGRGTDRVVIAGELAFEAGQLEIARLQFAGTVRVQAGQMVEFSQCVFLADDIGVDAADVAELRIGHCEFRGYREAGVVARGGTGLFAAGNWFDGGPGPALRVGRTEAVIFSGYNAFAAGSGVWEVGGQPIDLAALPDGMEQFSFVVSAPAGDPGIEGDAGSAGLAAKGPLGKPVGTFPTRPRSAPRVAGPFLHSVTDTTANIEWWTSLPANCEIAWGPTPDCANTATVGADGFLSFSLCELQPGGVSYFQIRAAKPTGQPGYVTGLDAEFDSQPMKIQTMDSAPAPRTFYLSPDGSDGADGLSQATAWRSPNRAAAETVAGDTVLLGAGKYHGTVWIRGTGARGRPVTWRAAPGEQVIFDGLQRRVGRGFIVNYKQDLNFDGLRFELVGMDEGLGQLNPTGVFVVNGSDRIQITRCFMDGHGPGYCPPFLRGSDSRDVLVKNCVITGGFQGIHVSGFDRFVLENNVFLRNMIAALILGNRPEQKAVFRNNIVTDSLPIKHEIQLFEIPYDAAIQQENNCFFLRYAPEERKNVVWFYQSAGKLKLPEWFELHGGNGSVARNPRFAAMPELPEGSAADAFLPDILAGRRPLDFAGLFSTDEELLSRDIGLQPAAFAPGSKAD